MKSKILQILNEFKAPYDSGGVYVNAINEDDFPAIAEKIEALDNWVSVEERLPTKDDADKKGNVLGMDRIQNEVHKCDFNDIVQMKIRFTHWQPLPSKPKNI